MKFLWYFWQFPQSLLALILIAVLKPERREVYRGRVYYFYSRKTFISGVSLGEFVILPERYDNRAVRDHEWGHTVQSRMFGPLYLLVIGIASAVFNNLWDRVFHKGWTAARRTVWYYGRYPEAWADRLGGVER
jgi:hypothetical protein